ncbi:MAG: sodium:calcium antiporter [Nanoarchaeales archaeon]|nr:sodium:calcium antiporter [Nanoarchaeales archaeon]
MELILYISVFLVGFYMISKAADYFVDEAANIGTKHGMSKLMIGLTIVAIGTSLPEMITSLGAILFTPNYSEFIIGTTLGSNITNILLAFGLFLIIAKKFTIKKDELFNIIALIGTSIVFIIFILFGFVSYVAIALVIFYTYYILYQKKYQKLEIEEIEEKYVDKTKHSSKKSYIIIALSFIGLFIGAKLTILGIENIGSILSIPSAYLNLVVVSIATSLPEIGVTIASAKRKEYLMAIGNIVGTNIMNVCLIIGTSGFFGNYLVQTDLYLSSIVIFSIATLLFSFLIYRKKFTPVFGYIFIILYVLYVLMIFT